MGTYTLINHINHILQATTILRTLLESTVDHIPYKLRTKVDGKKVVAMSLLSSFHSSSICQRSIVDQLELKEV